jgi:hypothetical protein
VFENRVQRRMFGPKMDEVTGGWRKLQNEELHNFCSSPDIIRTVRARRMGWAGHVARTEAINSYKIFVGKPEGKRLSKDVGLVTHGRIILKRILGK